MIVILVTLASPVQVYSVPPPWNITAEPDVVYVRPPQCTMSFTIYVTNYYKTQPIRVFIERDPRNPLAPTKFLYDGSDQVPTRIPDWQSTVTALFTSPWETPPGRYTLKIYAFPPGEVWGDVYTTVDYVIEDTGVKTCSEDHVTATFTTFTTPSYTVSTTYRTTTWEPPPEQPPSLWDQIARILPTVVIVAVILAIVVLAAVLARRRSAHRLRGATAVKARFCTNCGATIPEGSGYCPNCGEKI
jgi:hypothetical protein